MKLKQSVILTIFFLFSMLSFAGEFENINDFSAVINETTFINKQKKSKKYILKIVFPNKVYKEILSPELNAGEKYFYDGKIKKTYYPILEEVMEEEIDSDENTLLKALKDIRNNTSEIKKIKKDNKLERIIYDDGYEVEFLDYKKIGDENFPEKVNVFENSYLITTLSFQNIKINQGISLNDIELK